jgi:ABC-2 type transport system ATP-binding protein
MTDDRRPVQARGLVKRYGAVMAVDHVDLTVERGDVYGFLGPNGAGKTTTLRILLALIHPDEGEARLFGRNPQTEMQDALEGVGGFVETPAFYPYLSGRTNLALLAAFDRDNGHQRIDQLLALVDLAARANDRVGHYSQGMKQRLGVAASLLREPQLLLLDEPTNGLDPGGMRDMRRLVGRLSSEGITVLLSSHLLAEAEELCNRVAIIRSGKVVFEGKLEDLRAGAGTRYRLRTTDLERARAVLQPREVEVEDGELTFTASEDEVAALSRELVDEGLGITALVPERLSLESLFFELTESEEPVEAVA